MKPMHILLAALATVATWGATVAGAEPTTNEDSARNASTAPELTQADIAVDQLAWAETGVTEDDENDNDRERASDREEDEDEDEEAERASNDRPGQAERFRRPWIDREQMRELFEKMRAARAEGDEEAVRGLLREFRERRGDAEGPPFGPGMGRPGPGPGQPGREGLRPPLDRGPGPRGDRPPRAGRSDEDQGPRDQPAEARRDAGPPREGWTQPDRPRRGGTQAARRGGQRPSAEPGGRAQVRRQPRWQRPGQAPWGGPPQWQRPRQFGWGTPPSPQGRGRFPGPPAGAGPGLGARPQAPQRELRQLREEMQALRKAIEQLTTEVQAARQQR